MDAIFISYRREDSARWTGRLAAYQRDQFGAESIFSDIDTIEPGADFTDAITRAVGACDVLLAVIGPHWLTETDTNNNRRLDDPTDWVRTEIVAALSRKIRVIPVLVGQAGMPATRDLPPEIRTLADRQAHELSDKNWDYDCYQLVNRLAKTIEFHTKLTQRIYSPKTLLISVLTLVVISLIVAFLFRTPLLNQIKSSSPGSSLASFHATKDPEQPALATDNRQGSETAGSIESGHGPPSVQSQAAQEVRLKIGYEDYTYKILSLDLTRADSSTLKVRSLVRLTVNSKPGAVFRNDSFRLLINGVPQPPVGRLTNLLTRTQQVRPQWN